MVYFYKTVEEGLARISAQERSEYELVQKFEDEKDYATTTPIQNKICSYYLHEGLKQPWVGCRDIVNIEDIPSIVKALREYKSKIHGRYYHSNILQVNELTDTYKASDILDPKCDQFFRASFRRPSKDIIEFVTQGGSLLDQAVAITAEEVPLKPSSLKPDFLRGTVSFVEKESSEFVYVYLKEDEVMYSSIKPIDPKFLTINNCNDFKEFLGPNTNTTTHELFQFYIQDILK